MVAKEDCCSAQLRKAWPLDEPKKSAPEGAAKLDMKDERSERNILPNTATSTVGIDVELNNVEFEEGGEERDARTKLAASAAATLVGKD